MTKDFKLKECVIMTLLQKALYSFLFAVKSTMIWLYLHPDFHSLFYLYSKFYMNFPWIFMKPPVQVGWVWWGVFHWNMKYYCMIV